MEPLELARRLPDVPRWVDTRGMLLSGLAEVRGGELDPDGTARGGDHEPGGFVVSAMSGAVCVVAIVGTPAAALIREATSSATSMTPVICQTDGEEHAAAVLGGWKRERAIMHTLGRGVTVPPPSAHVRLLEPGETGRLAHLPAGLRHEIGHAMQLVPMAARFAEGRPVAFCYPCWRTETLWDISIDTVEGFRRRGYAEDTVRFMIHHMRTVGREPVWGASETNHASLGLAAKIGFAPVDEIRVFSPEGFWSFFSGGFEPEG